MAFVPFFLRVKIRKAGVRFGGCSFVYKLCKMRRPGPFSCQSLSVCELPFLQEINTYIYLSRSSFFVLQLLFKLYRQEISTTSLKASLITDRAIIKTCPVEKINKLFCSIYAFKSSYYVNFARPICRFDLNDILIIIQSFMYF